MEHSFFCAFDFFHDNNGFIILECFHSSTFGITELKMFSYNLNLIFFSDEKIPKILLVPEDQIAKKNESIRFDCVFEQTTFLQWFFYDSEPLSNSSRYD